MHLYGQWGVLNGVGSQCIYIYKSKINVLRGFAALKNYYGKWDVWVSKVMSFVLWCWLTWGRGNLWSQCCLQPTIQIALCVPLICVVRVRQHTMLLPCSTFVLVRCFPTITYSLDSLYSSHADILWHFGALDSIESSMIISVAVSGIDFFLT